MPSDLKNIAHRNGKTRFYELYGFRWQERGSSIVHTS